METLRERLAKTLNVHSAFDSTKVRRTILTGSGRIELDRWSDGMVRPFKMG